MINGYKQNYEMTDYPKIFKDIYWGKFEFNNIRDNGIEEVIKNRNDFIKKYGIYMNSYSVFKRVPQYVSRHLDRNSRTEETLGIKNRLLDHTEVFENDEVFILVTSPYRDNEEEFDDTSLLSQGWIKTDMLYYKSANSYIKFISKRKRKNN